VKLVPSTLRPPPSSTPVDKAATLTTTTTPPTPPPATKPTTTPGVLAPLPSQSDGVAKAAGQGGAPSWATPGYFHGLQTDPKALGGGAKGLVGGSGLQVRLGAMTSKPTATTPAGTTTQTTAEQAKRRATGLSLLQKVAHSVGVIAGRPLTADEIRAAPKALHLTRPEHVASILSEGLRPTTGLYKNLTTWFRSAVYMFGREPSGAQKFMNFSTAASSATATIEIDLQKLDPAKLFKRVVDGAIIYVSKDPIAPDALRLRSGS
jgi:hypothetical protein